MAMTYLSRLTEQKERVISELKKRGVESRYLEFGGSGIKGAKAYVPTDANSEFLANRAMGDWTERALSNGLSHAFQQFQIVHYGDSDRMAAGENGFREFYITRLEDVRVHGKRPDLLLTTHMVGLDTNVTARSTTELAAFVRQAWLAVEVRSSKFEALRYIQVRAEQKAAGKKGGRKAPSFTVKVEDLKIVYRWIEKHEVEQVYCQVFFDSVFALNVLKIFDIIGSGKGFTIENPAKNQEKATIMIPITAGVQIGIFHEKPSFKVEHKTTELGRHDVYVRPEGGKIEIDADAFKTTCWASETLR